MHKSLSTAKSHIQERIHLFNRSDRMNIYPYKDIALISDNGSRHIIESTAIDMILSVYDNRIKNSRLRHRSENILLQIISGRNIHTLLRRNIAHAYTKFIPQRLKIIGWNIFFKQFNKTVMRRKTEFLFRTQP